VPSVNSSSPRDEYTRRLEDRRRRNTFLAQRERVLGFSRLGVFLGGVVVAFLAFYFQWFSAWWLAVPIAVFSALLIWHERVARAGRRVLRARPGAAQRRLEGQGSARHALPRRDAPLRGGPRPVRSRLAVRAALHRTHAHWRGDVGVMAQSAGGAGRSPRASAS